MQPERFLAHLADEQCAPNTLKAYSADLRHFCQWFEAENQSQCTHEDVTPTDLRRYRDGMLEANTAAATINRRLACLRRYFKWAADSKQLQAVPKVPKSIQTAKQAPRALDRRQEFSLLRAVERSLKPRDIAIFKILFNTALRVGELANLRFEDVLLAPKCGSLHVRHAKGTKTRDVPLNAEARAALRNYLAVRPEVAHDFVFVGQRGEPFGIRGVESLFAKYGHLAKLQGVTPHVARHTTLTRLIRNGTDAPLVASIAGHASLSMLMRYTAPSHADKATALERLA